MVRSHTALTVSLGVYLLTTFCCFSEPQLANDQKPKDAALAAYQKIIFDAIGRRWYDIMLREANQMTLGVLHVSFSVLPDGHIKDIRTITNTGNQHFETATRRAIIEARIPPIPSSLLKTLPGHRMDVDINFKTFANP
jgi:outer membrane biosynthesis protein TonB